MLTLQFEEKSKVEFSNSYVIDFEDKFKIKLPAELIEFLKIQNGGTLRGECYFDKHLITDFYPLFDESYGTISQVMKYLISEDIEKMIPFAGDPDSLTYCLSINEKDYGKIFCYRGGDWIQGESPLFKICDSFREFINSIKVND